MNWFFTVNINNDLNLQDKNKYWTASLGSIKKKNQLILQKQNQYCVDSSESKSIRRSVQISVAVVIVVLPIQCTTCTSHMTRRVHINLTFDRNRPQASVQPDRFCTQEPRHKPSRHQLERPLAGQRRMRCRVLRHCHDYGWPSAFSFHDNWAMYTVRPASAKITCGWFWERALLGFRQEHVY